MGLWRWGCGFGIMEMGLLGCGFGIVEAWLFASDEIEEKSPERKRRRNREMNVKNE